jgi:hypothetical protein
MFQLTAAAAAAAVQEAKRAQQCAGINCEEFITASDANTFCVRRRLRKRLTRKIALIKHRLGGMEATVERREKRTQPATRLFSSVIFAVIYSREKIIIKKGKVHNNHIKIKRKDQTCRQTTEKKSFFFLYGNNNNNDKEV